MSKITYTNKQAAIDPSNPATNEQFSAADANEVKSIINTNDDIVIALKAQVDEMAATINTLLDVNGLIKLAALPVNYVDENTIAGDGLTPQTPWRVIAVDNAVYTTPDAPTAFVTNDGVGTNSGGWTPRAGVTDPTKYEYSITGSAPYATCTANPQPIADVPVEVGDFVIRERAGVGTNPSLPLVNTVAFTGTQNTTPAVPTLTADNGANTLSASHALGTSEIVMSVNNAAYIAYSAISVGDVDRADGYWKFKIKSAAGRNESAVVNSPAFTAANTTPAAPTLTVDNTADTLAASHALGTSEIVMSVNNATYVAYSAITVGNVDRAAGYWKFKIKSATGRNESAVVDSPAFTATGGTVYTDIDSGYYELAADPVITGNNIAFENGQYGFAYTLNHHYIPAGAVGELRANVNVARTGILALDPNDANESNPNAYSFSIQRNAGQGKINAEYSGTTKGSVTIAASELVEMRLRLTGSLVYAEYTLNNGTSWVSLGNAPQPNVPLYFKTWAHEFPSYMNNIRGVGFVID